jgi:hypothetical protein
MMMRGIVKKDETKMIWMAFSCFNSLSRERSPQKQWKNYYTWTHKKKWKIIFVDSFLFHSREERSRSFIWFLTAGRSIMKASQFTEFFTTTVCMYILWPEAIIWGNYGSNTSRDKERVKQKFFKLILIDADSFWRVKKNYIFNDERRTIHYSNW